MRDKQLKNFIKRVKFCLKNLKIHIIIGEADCTYSVTSKNIDGISQKIVLAFRDASNTNKVKDLVKLMTEYVK